LRHPKKFENRKNFASSHLWWDEEPDDDHRTNTANQTVARNLTQLHLQRTAPLKKDNNIIVTPKKKI